MSGFQKFVNQQPAPAVAGDFAGANPRASVPGNGFAAYSGGLVMGRFAWFNPDTGVARNASANGGLLGFVHREQQSLLTAFLQEAGLTIPGGYPAYGMSRGDFWADFPAGINAGDPVYANNTTGAAQASSSGATLTPFVAATTVPVPAVSDANSTIALNTGVLTIAAMASGAFAVGQSITWAGLDANTKVFITRQISGTPGGAGTYQTTYTNHAAVSATTVTGVAGTLAKISTWVQPT